MGSIPLEEVSLSSKYQRTWTGLTMGALLFVPCALGSSAKRMGTRPGSCVRIAANSERTS